MRDYDPDPENGLEKVGLIYRIRERAKRLGGFDTIREKATIFSTVGELRQLDAARF